MIFTSSSSASAAASSFANMELTKRRTNILYGNRFSSDLVYRQLIFLLTLLLLEKMMIISPEI